MRNKLAVVFCVHHRPWLIMSTLITLMLQDDQDFDVHIIYNVDPSADRAQAANNPQLSPFDERVREVCQLKDRPIVEHEFENDEALDSGAWYKFLRSRQWLGYDWVLFVGEGTLFARPRLLSGMLALTSHNPNVHVIASGHEKRRIAKDQFFAYCERQAHLSDADRLHDCMIAEGFEIFGRDPAFRRLIDAWGSGFPVETEHHVPDSGPPSAFLRRIRTAWIRRWGAPSSGAPLAAWPWAAEYLRARSLVWRPPVAAANGTDSQQNPEGIRPTAKVGAVQCVNGVRFHRVDDPAWFGCATNHLMSRSFLERFTAKLDEFGMWDVLTLPFSGTSLEVIWGFLPAWLGYEKWFTDGFHRVRKDFVTYRREDYPPEMATYLNRYYPGRIAVGWAGDYLKIRALARDLSRVRDELPAAYF